MTSALDGDRSRKPRVGCTVHYREHHGVDPMTAVIVRVLKCVPGSVELRVSPLDGRTEYTRVALFSKESAVARWSWPPS